MKNFLKIFTLFFFVYVQGQDINTSFNSIFIDSINPLVFIDGKKKNYDEIKLLNPDKIKSVSVLKDSFAISEYGTKVKNGVIIIKTKVKLD